MRHLSSIFMHSSIRFILNLIKIQFRRGRKRYGRRGAFLWNSWVIARGNIFFKAQFAKSSRSKLLCRWNINVENKLNLWKHEIEKERELSWVDEWKMSFWQLQHKTWSLRTEKSGLFLLCHASINAKKKSNTKNEKQCKAWWINSVAMLFWI